VIFLKLRLSCHSSLKLRLSSTCLQSYDSVQKVTTQLKKTPKLRLSPGISDAVRCRNFGVQVLPVRHACRWRVRSPTPKLRLSSAYVRSYDSVRQNSKVTTQFRPTPKLRLSSHQLQSYDLGFFTMRRALRPGDDVRSPCDVGCNRSQSYIQPFL
jgi:hypothetical protein